MKQLTDEQREQIILLRNHGFPPRAISVLIDVPEKRIQNYFSKYCRSNRKEGEFSEYTAFRFNVLLDRFIAGLEGRNSTI